MKKVTIEIIAKFGSKHQEQFSKNVIFSSLKAHKLYMQSSHKKNEIQIKINGDRIQNLSFFNWEEVSK